MGTGQLDTAMVREAMDRFRNGDSLSDAELLATIKLLEQTLQSLDTLGRQRYALVCSDLRRCLTTLEGFREARKRG